MFDIYIPWYMCLLSESTGFSKRKGENTVSPNPPKQARVARALQKQGNAKKDDIQRKPDNAASQPMTSENQYFTFGSLLDSEIRKAYPEYSKIRSVPGSPEVIVIDDPELTEDSRCEAEVNRNQISGKTGVGQSSKIVQKNVPLKNKRSHDSSDLSPDVEGVISHLLNFCKKPKPMEKKEVAESQMAPLQSPRFAKMSETSKSEKLPAEIKTASKSISETKQNTAQGEQNCPIVIEPDLAVPNESDLFFVSKQLSSLVKNTDFQKSKEEKITQCLTAARPKMAQNMFLTKSVLSVLESNPTLLSKTLQDTTEKDIRSENRQSIHPYLKEYVRMTNWEAPPHLLAKINAVMHQKYPAHSIAKIAPSSQDGSLGDKRQHISKNMRNDSEHCVSNEKEQTDDRFASTSGGQVSVFGNANIRKSSSVNPSGSDLTGALKRLSSLAQSFSSEKLKNIGRNSNIESQSYPPRRNSIPEVPNLESQSLPSERFSTIVQSIARETVKEYGLPSNLKGNTELHAERLKLVPALDFSQFESLGPQNLEVPKGIQRHPPIKDPKSFIPDAQKLERLSSLIQSIVQEKMEEYGKPDLGDKGELLTESLKRKLVPAVDFSKLDDSTSPPPVEVPNLESSTSSSGNKY